MVENLIKVWGSGEYDIAGQILDPAEMGGKRKKSLPNEGNDLLAMMADIDSAMKRLDDRHRLVLVRRIVEDETLESIGEEMEISAQRVDQLVDAGVKRIIDFLGGRNPGQ
jgi:DNA-directed RNA polymerase specialized sigma subunit